MLHAIEKEGNVIILRILEDLGSHNATPFRELIEKTADRGYERVVLDFTGVKFISSMAITSLFGIYKKLKNGGGGLGIVGISPELAKIFELVGLPSLVRTFSSQQEALAFLQEGDV